ncbi:hypothetical protein QTG54_015103 [Skeletonema marinoi]|uniref:Uncharacterized protein n=1 Tax=Skeletonema marinoi TaxID=267567 RepID=A0AAD9D5X4_9STRA|nr:hypothetical protein QTG54_015103 [Skeletonema marinoi]
MGGRRSTSHATTQILQSLIDAAPASVRSVDNYGRLPLHHLCKNEDDRKAMQILKLLIEKQPEAIRHADNNGCLPIHMTSVGKSPEYCRLLIEAYPGSERMSNRDGALPLHIVCVKNTVATVENFFKLYPDAINHATIQGWYPIHIVIAGLNHRDSPIAAAEIVQFLLGCDPHVKLQKFQGMSLLHYACQGAYNDSNIDAGILVIKAIYDEHPEAIEDDRIASNIHRYHQQVQSLIWRGQ